MSPKRGGAKALISKQLLAQTSLDIEGDIRNKLQYAIGFQLNQKSINGSGTAPIPRGILNTAGIPTVAVGANGGAPTKALMREFITKHKENNAMSLNTPAYFLTPGLESFLSDLEKVSGYPRYVLEDGFIEGYAAVASNFLPNNLTKGTGTALNAAIFGDFSGVYLGNWAGLDIVVDPITRADFGELKITVNSYWDVAVPQPNKLVIAKDFDIA